MQRSRPGTATIEYDDPKAASSALLTFDGEAVSSQLACCDVSTSSRDHKRLSEIFRAHQQRSRTFLHVKVAFVDAGGPPQVADHNCATIFQASSDRSGTGKRRGRRIQHQQHGLSTLVFWPRIQNCWGMQHFVFGRKTLAHWLDTVRLYVYSDPP